MLFCLFYINGEKHVFCMVHKKFHLCISNANEKNIPHMEIGVGICLTVV